MKILVFLLAMLSGSVWATGGHYYDSPIIYKLYDAWGRPEVYITKLPCIPYHAAEDDTWYCIHRVERHPHGFSPPRHDD